MSSPLCQSPFDDSIAERLGPTAQDTDFPAEDLTPKYELFGDVGDANFDLDPAHEDVKVTPEAGGNMLASTLFPKGGTMTRGRVTAQKRDTDGNPKGRANFNPILDTREYYTVTFDNGDVTELTVNLIAESMYAQCDPDSNQYVLLDSLQDHQHLDRLLRLSDQTVVRNDGRTYKKQNTVGGQICCQWKDGLSSWEKLSDLKESHPLETAEYPVTMGINHKPAFNWWVPRVLKKRDQIISAVNRCSTHYLKRTHNFCIEMSRTVKEALELDRQNGNTFWADAIAKEMIEVQKAFDILPDGTTAPVGYQKIPCHMIFDVKMEDFKHKAQLVAGGHMTKAPAKKNVKTLLNKSLNIYDVKRMMFCLSFSVKGQSNRTRAM